MADRLIEAAAAVDLPLPPLGWFDLSYCITIDGTLGLLRCDGDLWGAYDDACNAGSFGAPPLRPGARATVSLFDGRTETAAVEIPLIASFPLFDRRPQGEWIVVDARCKVGDSNAMLFSGDGEKLGEFCLGDGIQHLQCDEDGALWVGYFDEGVFGNLGWGIGGPEPIGAAGLVRFAANGTPEWRFDGTAPGATFIADCYALNVTGREAWACYYMDFPIVHIAADGAVRHWENQVAGARALAVDGPHLMLAGGYQDDRDRIALLELDDGTARGRASHRLGLADLRRRQARLHDARGDTLHIVCDGTWFRLSVSAARAASGLDVR